MGVMTREHEMTEECEHRRYAERDLAVLEAGA
jgi:hypothetical protein